MTVRKFLDPVKMGRVPLHVSDTVPWGGKSRQAEGQVVGRSFISTKGTGRQRRKMRQRSGQQGLDWPLGSPAEDSGVCPMGYQTPDLFCHSAYHKIL